MRSAEELRRTEEDEPSTSSALRVKRRLEDDDEADAIHAQLAVAQIAQGRFELGLALLRNCKKKTAVKTLLSIINAKTLPSAWKMNGSLSASAYHLKWLCLREYRDLSAAEGKQSEADTRLSENLEFSLLLQYVGHAKLTELGIKPAETSSVNTMSNAEASDLKQLFQFEWEKLSSNGTAASIDANPSFKLRASTEERRVCIEKLFLIQPTLLSLLVQLFRKREKVRLHSLGQDASVGAAFVLELADVELAFLQRLLDEDNFMRVELLVPYIYVHHDVNFKRYECFVTSLLNKSESCKMAFHAICASGSLPLIKLAESAEDQRLLSLYPDGLMSYLVDQIDRGKEISPQDTTLIKLTRLHNENLYLCFIEIAITIINKEKDLKKAKRVLRNLPELHSIFLVLLWDNLLNQQDSQLTLQDIETAFDTFQPAVEGDDLNTMSKASNILKHRIGLASNILADGGQQDTNPLCLFRDMNTKSIAQLLSDIDVYNEKTVNLAEKIPTYSNQQKVLLQHDLNIYHVRGFIFAFFQAFSLTNISVADTDKQETELEALLERMKEHVNKTACSFSRTWMAWFCYVFFNCRYHENISNWKSVGSDFFKSNVKQETGSSSSSMDPQEGKRNSKLAVKLFDAVITLIEESISTCAPIDEDYIDHILNSVGRRDEAKAVSSVLLKIVDGRKSALDTFVDQARWRLNIITQLFSSEISESSASWPEIFKILHATPTSLLQICKSYNKYGLCDETVRRYSIPESEASSVHLAEWIDGLTTRVSVDGMITQMSMHSSPQGGVEAVQKSAVEDFESYIQSCKMDDMDKLLLYIDVGTAVAPYEEVSSRMFATAQSTMRSYDKGDESEVPEDKIILDLCDKVLSAISQPSKKEVASVPKRLTSANLQDNASSVGEHTKAVQMLLEALKMAKDGRKQFLSGVLHNICRALSVDGGIRSETFKGRLHSVGLCHQLLSNNCVNIEQEPQHWDYMSTFISYLAHIGDAIASVDNQDTYNHFNLLQKDPKDILMYVLFERKDPEIASRIAKLLHTNLIDEVLKACVPQIHPPIFRQASIGGQAEEAMSKHDWGKNILVLKSLVEKSPLRIALACLFSYRNSNEENDILTFALEQLSSYPTLHRWIKIQFFIQQMKNRITNESSGSNTTTLDAGFEHEHTSGALKGCLWEDLEVYSTAIERMVSNGKLEEAILLSDKCFEGGSSDALLNEIIDAEESNGKWQNILFLALRFQDADRVWQMLQRFKGRWSLDDLILLASKCKSIAIKGSEMHSLSSKLHKQLNLYRQILLIDGTYNEDWQDVKMSCQSNPENVLKRLSTLGAHKLVSDVAQEFGCSDVVLRELQGEAILSCLSEKSVDGGGIAGVTRRLDVMDKDQSLVVAFFALRSARDIASKKVFLSYISEEVNKQILEVALTSDNVSYVSQVQIGINILDQLPNALALKYEGLVEKPSLILENLIISLEIPLAKNICLLYPDLLSNERIAFYAYKACCFDQVVEKEGAQDDNSISGASLQGEPHNFPELVGESGDDLLRESYNYSIAPSVPLCESILGLTPLPLIAALNCTRVAIELALDFLNDDLEKRKVSTLSILSHLERTETILEIIEKAQEYFEHTFSQNNLEFEGWESMWDTRLSERSVYNFDLCREYEEIVALLELDNDPGNLRDLLVNVTNFAVRVDLIHTLLSHDIPVSFRDFATRSAIEETVSFITEEEYYNIAIFVSNKFALDPSNIWEAWGLGLLDLCEYTEARLKIERAIKTSVPFSGDAKQIEIALRAVETLEKGQMVKVSEVYDMCHKALQEKDKKDKSWFKFRDSKSQGKNASEANQIEGDVYSECIYYLKKFAPESLLEFYFKHEQYRKACLLTIEKKSNAYIESLSKACIRFDKEVVLTDFFATELKRDSDNKEAIIELLRHAIVVVCEEKSFSLAYQLQMLDCKGTACAVLALRSFKDSNSREDADMWLQNSMEQILEAPGKENHKSFLSLGIECRDLGISNLLELKSIVSLQMDVMKFAEKNGTDFKSWDIVGSGDMISFHRRRAAEMILLKDGNLAFRIIQEFRLQATEVYIDAIRLFCKSKKQIGSLIPLVKDLKGTLGDYDWDHVIGSAFFVLLNECNDRARAKQIMKLLVSDHSKILALIALGKLDKAFNLAVGCADEVDVELIAKHARSKGLDDLVRKCENYLRNK